MPYFGSSVSSARACAGDVRPWRRTKLRIARRPRVPDDSGGAGSSAESDMGSAAGRLPAGIVQPPLERFRFRRFRQRILDGQRIRVLPCHRRIAPRLRGPPLGLAQRAIRGEAPDHETILASRLAEIGSGEPLAILTYCRCRRKNALLARRAV